MSMGTRKRQEKQEDIWIAHMELASAPADPFYQRLNELQEALIVCGSRMAASSTGRLMPTVEPSAKTSD